MDKTEIKKFLDVYPDAYDVVVQTFIDDKTQNVQSWYVQYQMRDLIAKNKFDELDKLNKQWVSVCFSINAIKQWAKRDNDNVAKISSWACDIDEWTKEEQQKKIKWCPLIPSMIVETKRWYHLYRFAKDWTKENFKKINTWLCNYFWWDFNARDLARILRLPWFYHIKDINDPYLVKIIYKNKNKIYTEQEMLWVFSDTTTPQEKKALENKEQYIKKTFFDDTDNSQFRDKVRNLPPEDMLSYLSWSAAVGWDIITFKNNSNWTKQIYVNWESTSCRLDTSWMIGSLDKWWPTRISRVARYKNSVDRKEIRKIVEKTHPELIEKKVAVAKMEQYETTDNQIDLDSWDFEAEKKKQSESLSKIKDVYKQWKLFKFPVESLNTNLGAIHLSEFTIIIWAPWAWKTTFSLITAIYNMLKWLKVWFISCEMTAWDLIDQHFLWEIWAMERFDNATLTEEDEKKLKEYRDKIILNPNFYMKDDLSCTISKLHTYVDLCIKYWCEAIIIDNLVKIVWCWKELDDNREVIEYLYHKSKESNVAIILLHHTDKISSLNWWESFRWTWDTHIKPDNMFFIRRDTTWKSDEALESMSADEKLWVTIKRTKQRLWSSHLWSDKMYFYKWMYYNLNELQEAFQWKTKKLL